MTHAVLPELRRSPYVHRAVRSGREPSLNAFLHALYPQLRALDERERLPALQRARETPFDALELVGMAAALVVATALTRYGISGLDVAERFAAALVNFVLALPLLALGIAPFVVRRTRRGLREQRQGHAGT